jgi:hypothetical protein
MPKSQQGRNQMIRIELGAEIDGPDPKAGNPASCSASKNGSGMGYSISSSARPLSASVTVIPSAFAVLRLIISSTLVVLWTGRSPGFRSPDLVVE